MADRQIDTGPGTSPDPPAMEGLTAAPMDDRNIDTSPGPSPNPPAMEAMRAAPNPSPPNTEHKPVACGQDEQTTKPKVDTAGK